ncbi:hypothetical protein [Duganella aceris]|uniref:Uncharacterized protein n=1 Tax=Duganella aceris TaxID=2703883 RepID=A0ABX0FUS5_9BURK|nr:hypothetical protein [Duganella aceris]NGZ88237.1 hypothetical protein [Duganella aceris]
MTEILEPAVPADAPPPKKRRRWGRMVLYILATLGVLAIALVVAIAVKASKEPPLVKIDEAASIDESMTRNYGKYSAEKKGWVYVDESNEPFLVRVVQQARIEAVGASDELYFVTSGSSLGASGRNFFGVFQIRSDGKGGDGLVEISDPHRYGSAVPVTPERVRFEALSESGWAWVVKVQSGVDPKQERVEVSNVMLAPHGDNIALLASFKASADAEAGDCLQANIDHASWIKQVAHYESLPEDAPSEEVAAGEALSEHEPLRCEHARWTYGTAAVVGAQPGPLTVTAKGTQYAAPLEARTWKIMFDNKAFVYNVPPELTVE